MKDIMYRLYHVLKQSVQTEVLRIPLSLRYDRKSMTVWMMSSSASPWPPVDVKQNSPTVCFKFQMVD